MEKSGGTEGVGEWDEDGFVLGWSWKAGRCWGRRRGEKPARGRRKRSGRGPRIGPGGRAILCPLDLRLPPPSFSPPPPLLSTEARLPPSPSVVAVAVVSRPPPVLPLLLSRIPPCAQMAEFCKLSIFGTVFEVTTRYVDLQPVGMGAFGLVCSAKDEVRLCLQSDAVRRGPMRELTRLGWYS